tara:strand:+ start:130 stop:1077 length:948 start_codon:yes stop_codon:yes gene_type:complete
MTFLQEPPTRVLGFDVSKDTITIFDSAVNQVTNIANSARALRRLFAHLEGNCLAVCEPTGGHEALLIAELSAASIACHRVDTLKTKAFVRSFGTLAKTDAIDARALALYGQERWKSLALFTPVADEQTRLAALIARRQEMVAMKVAETCRLKAPGAPALNASYKAILRTINNQLEKLDRQIEDLIDACQTLKRRVAACMSLEGVGSRTAITLAAIMPELGSLTRRQAAALAGLAPHPRDSGTLRGYRRMHGGRPQVRTALFMAALAASRTKGPLKAFYQRLIENGKKPIVAISAIMRKIIVILNARIRDQTIKQS